MYNLPNILTISRIVVIPAIFLSVYITSSLWALIAAVLFIIASITDYLAQASLNDLQKVEGISKKVAEKIYSYFHN